MSPTPPSSSLPFQPPARCILPQPVPDLSHVLRGHQERGDQVGQAAGYPRHRAVRHRQLCSRGRVQPCDTAHHCAQGRGVTETDGRGRQEAGVCEQAAGRGAGGSRNSSGGRGRGRGGCARCEGRSGRDGGPGGRGVARTPVVGGRAELGRRGSPQACSWRHFRQCNCLGDRRAGGCTLS